MEIINLKTPKVTVINGKEISYEKMEVHTHEVKPVSRVRFADIDPTDIVKNIIHNAYKMGNGIVDAVSNDKTQVVITDAVGSTLIINKWVIDNSFIKNVTEQLKQENHEKLSKSN